MMRLACRFVVNFFFLIYFGNIATVVGLRARGYHNTSGNLTESFHASAAQLINLCAGGKFLPELYVLGAQKSATTSLALDLVRAGVESAAGDQKELRFFDDGLRQVRSMWLRQLPVCPASEIRRVLADFSPRNLAHTQMPVGWKPSTEGQKQVDVPALLSSFYGPQASRRLNFVVMLREPLSRMRSAWHHSHQLGLKWDGAAGPSFSKDLSFSLQEALHGKYTNWLWRSMYSRHIESFLDHFEPRQFVIVPFLQYMQINRQGVACSLSKRLRYPNICEQAVPHAEAPHANSRTYPALENDVPQQIRLEFEHFIAAENGRLVQLLARTQRQGAELANYHDRMGDDHAIKSWLEAAW